MKRKLLTAVGVIVAVLLIAVIVVPFFVNAESFRPTIASKLSGALGRKVEIGHLGFSLLSGSLTAGQVSIGDDPAFSQSPFLTAQKLDVGVDVWPLLTSHDLHINTVTLAGPQLTLLRSALGKWNFESLGGSTSSRPAKKADAGATSGALWVRKIQISDGKVVIARQGSNAANRPYTDVQLTVENVSQDSAIPVKLSARSPGGGQMKMDGTIGPLGTQEAARAPFEATLKAEKLPAEDLQQLLGAIGVGVPSGSSLRGGVVNADLKLKGPIERLVTTGLVSINNLNVSGFNLGSKLNAFGAAMRGQGGSDTLIQLLSSQMRVAPEGIRADDLKMIIPALGTLTGAGTVSPSNALNFNMVAKLNNPSAAFAALGNIPGLSQTNGELPFKIQGTTSNPVFIPDVQGIAGGLLKNPLQNPQQQGQGLGETLGGLLGKKKKP